MFFLGLNVVSGFLSTQKSLKLVKEEEEEDIYLAQTVTCKYTNDKSKKNI